VLDIKDLERRWLKYKIKFFLPYIVAFISIIAITIGTITWFTKPSNESVQNHIQKKSQVSANLSKQKENSTLPAITVLEPSMDFVQTFSETPYKEETPISNTPKPVVSPSSSTLTMPPPPKMLSMPEPGSSGQPVEEISVSPSKSQKTLSINRNENKLDIEALKQRFKETPNANLGLFLTRYYYDQSNYSESYNYALKTNAINSKLDDSWILFSKSLVKLGKTEQAKKTLQVYIQQSNSENAKVLLDSIDKGTFR